MKYICTVSRQLKRNEQYRKEHHDNFFFFQRIIQEYFQPKIGRKIRKFNLGRKNNILIKKKSVLASKAPHKANWNTGFVTFQPAREGWNKIYIFYQVFQRWPKVEIWPSALLRNVQNIRNCMREKTIVSAAHECKRVKVFAQAKIPVSEIKFFSARL